MTTYLLQFFRCFVTVTWLVGITLVYTHRNENNIHIITWNNSIRLTTKSTITFSRRLLKNEASVVSIRQQVQQSNNNFPPLMNKNNQLKKIESSLIPKKLEDYLQAVQKESIEGLIMLRWNASGHLQQFTPITVHPRWLSNETVVSLFGLTSPSEHGKVALVYNNDVLRLMIRPKVLESPVPILMYTVPLNQTNNTNFILVPNPYDRSHNNERVIDDIRKFLGDSFMLTYKSYQQRKSLIVWRGTTHGWGEAPRVRLLNLSNSQSDSESSEPWLDVAKSAKGCKARKNGVQFLDQITMATQYKYQIDLGGVSGTSWGGLRWKMCSGGLVFRPTTWSKDWWHDTIKPWEHYIPFDENFLDLREKYDWAQNNQHQAFQIAQAGQKKCLETYASEYAQSSLMKMIYDLPPSSPDIANEANSLFENHLDEFYLVRDEPLHKPRKQEPDE